jgi:hypothetical protein
MYIRVWNKSDGVNRLHLQYLGLSTKRDDDSTIGQFGSGIKYAPILALRKCIDLVITAKDDDGQYQLKYDIVDIKGIEVIHYDYGTYKVPSSFTVDAGKLSWENEFQIYREVVSNAKDSAKSESDWGIELVEEVKFYDGEFSVFIGASPEIMGVFRNHDYYYCDKATVLFTYNNDISILENEYSNTAIYCKTVLVHESEDTSFFHYNVKSARLNEERKLANYFSLQYDLARAIVAIDNKETIDHVLDYCIGKEPSDQSSLEFWAFPTTIYQYLKANKCWQQRFIDMFGEKAVVLNVLEYSIPGVERKVTELGYIPISCRSDNLYEILKSANVKTLNEVAGQELNYELFFDYENYPNLVQALKIVEDYIPQFSSMKKKVGLFSPNSSEILGLTLNVNKPVPERQILISKSHAKTSSVENLVATLVHEYDHYSTGVADSNPEFRNLADTRIGELVVKSYRPEILHIEKGSRNINIKLSDLPYLQGLNFKIQKSEILDGAIINVGTKKFLVKSNEIANNLVGSLIPSEDNVSLSIANAFFTPVQDDSILIEEIK